MSQSNNDDATPRADEPTPIFFIGNKRSGTTLLVNILNEHPRVCITHESDIIWILFQARFGVPNRFKAFPLDGPRGIEATIAAYGNLIEDRLSAAPSLEVLRETYFVIQRLIAEQGTAIHPPLKSAANLAYLGDKKPVQNASPEVYEFLFQLFPNARFIHLVRHPQAVVGSMAKAADGWPVVPDYWKSPADELAMQWCIHEEWAIRIADSYADRVYSLRLEDLVNEPATCISSLFDFLKLEASSDLHQRLAKFVYSSPNEKYAAVSLPISRRLQALMDRFGYSPQS